MIWDGRPVPDFTARAAVFLSALFFVADRGLKWRGLALLDAQADTPSGPLIVRWSLHGGFRYEQAKARYEPFDRLVDEDPQTRRALAELAARYAIAGQPVLIAVNNKAEGSAPLTCVELARLIAEAIERMRHDG